MLFLISYCIENGEYVVVLNDAELYSKTGRHALVTFASSVQSVTLNGLNNELSGTITLDGGSEDLSDGQADEDNNDDDWKTLNG